MMPTIRIDDEVWGYLKSKATPFEDTPNDVLRRELKISSPQPTNVGVRMSSANLGRGPFIKPDKDYSYHSMKGCELNGKVIKCDSFADMLTTLFTLLSLAEDSGSFEKAALQLHGKKRPYFSKNSDDLRRPYQIPGKQLFVETNLSANNIVGFCRTFLQALGRDPASLKIL
jgi:negative regulator of replication initiation